MKAQWIIEVGIDGNNGYRECVGEIMAGEELDSAIALARELKGKTGEQAMGSHGMEAWTGVDASMGSRIAGFSVVYYDGEQTVQETYYHEELAHEEN